jgi:hypothetical protein
MQDELFASWLPIERSRTLPQEKLENNGFLFLKKNFYLIKEEQFFLETSEKNRWKHHHKL